MFFIYYYFFSNINFFHFKFCRYLQEFTALGTAGGMYHFRDQICCGNPDAFFVLNGDVCADLPLEELLSFHQSKNALVILKNLPLHL